MVSSIAKERDDLKALVKKVALKEYAYAYKGEFFKGSLEKALSSTKDLENEA